MFELAEGRFSPRRDGRNGWGAEGEWQRRTRVAESSCRASAYQHGLIVFDFLTTMRSAGKEYLFFRDSLGELRFTMWRPIDRGFTDAKCNTACLFDEDIG
jgi:hypothetical protein